MTGLAIRLDTADLDAVLDRAKRALARLAAVEPADRPVETFDALLRLLDSGEELVRLEAEHGTAGVTGDLVVRAQPTDRFRDLVAALRAGDGDPGVLKKKLSGHGSTSIGDSQKPMVDPPPAPVKPAAAGGVDGGRSGVPDLPGNNEPGR